MTKKAIFARYLTDDSGATAIEYGLIVALIGIGLIAGATAFSTSVNDLFSGVDSDMVKAFETPE